MIQKKAKKKDRRVSKQYSRSVTSEDEKSEHDKENVEEYVFEVNQWFSKKDGDGLIERELVPTKGNSNQEIVQLEGLN